MKHLILGDGNLGRDINKQLTRIGEEVHTLSRSHDWSYPRNESQIELFNKYDVFWVTVGAGSIEGAKKDFSKYCDLHIRLPMHILQTVESHKRVYLFSTDYLQNSSPNKNLYTLSKLMMEESVRMLDRGNCSIYRVGSLYGTHKPLSTFPGKCYLNNKNKSKLTLPRNIVIPTPTDWLADKLVSEWLKTKNHNYSTKVCHLAPSGQTTVADWGDSLFKGDKLIDTFFDRSRPKRPVYYKPGVLSMVQSDESKEGWFSLWMTRRPGMLKAIKLANGLAN